MKRTRNEGGEETTARARGTEGDGAENQYEITLARASAKLQVIKRADKQMKQREARGAASPRRGGEEQKKEDRRSVGRMEENHARGEKWRGSSSWAQNKYSAPSANERTKKTGEKRAR